MTHDHILSRKCRFYCISLYDGNDIRMDSNNSETMRTMCCGYCIDEIFFLKNRIFSSFLFKYIQSLMIYYINQNNG